MNLFDEIRADLVNESASLSNTLRKGKILASEMSLSEFGEWLDFELSGYTGKDKVPEYRSFRPVNLGMFSGPFGSGVKNMVIPTSELPEPVKEFAENLILFDGIGALEGMLSQSSGQLQVRWPQEAVMLSRDYLKMTGNVILVDAHQSIPRYIINGILDEVKNRLMDFILAMQESDITPENLDKGKVDTNVVRNLFNVNIYGSHNVVASGEDVHQEVTLVREGDVESLIGRLSKLGIDCDSLRELEEAVSSETSAHNGEFGPKVRAWIGGAVAKATSGAWQIGVATVTKEVIEALNGYYGI